MLPLDAKKVEAAMKKCESLGLSVFLETSGKGFGHPRQFWVKSKENPSLGPYPAKAIVAVSLSLGLDDVNGGYSQASSACNQLENLDFLIVDKAGVEIPRRILTGRIERNFQKKLNNIGATEISRMVKQRIGQDIFRSALLRYWGERCVVSGISDKQLLRASHIIPWSKCCGKLERERLNPENGLLLSSLWDSAFDAGLVSFSDNGSVLLSSKLSEEAQHSLDLPSATQFVPTIGHKKNLAWHRKHRFQA